MWKKIKSIWFSLTLLKMLLLLGQNWTPKNVSDDCKIVLIFRLFFFVLKFDILELVLCVVVCCWIMMIFNLCLMKFCWYCVLVLIFFWFMFRFIFWGFFGSYCWSYVVVCCIWVICFRSDLWVDVCCRFYVYKPL